MTEDELKQYVKSLTANQKKLYLKSLNVDDYVIDYDNKLEFSLGDIVKHYRDISCIGIIYKINTALDHSCEVYWSNDVVIEYYFDGSLTYHGDREIYHAKLKTSIAPITSIISYY